MNCEKFQTVAGDLAHELLMEANEQAAALKHAGECEECAARLDDERSLTLGLRALASDMKEVSAPPQLEAKMLAAFRERQNGNGVVVPITPIRSERRQSWYWAAAVAAALLMAFAIFAVRGNLSRKQDQLTNTDPVKVHDNVKPKDQPMEVKGSVAGIEPKRLTPVSPSPKRNDVAVGRKPKSLGPRANLNDAVASAAATQAALPAEVTTDFYPIGYTNTPNLQEGGQLLRVELPRAAVARFGLPVNMDRAGQRVKADVLVGSDGLAQAIRFVQ
jgi:hypothetical protein